MPGSGKSTLGAKFASLHAIKFRDTDELIKERTGGKIVDFWRANGEFYFRSLERMIFLELLSETPSVIATGGGLPLFMDNMTFIESQNSIFFDCEPQKLLVRIQEERRAIFQDHAIDLMKVLDLLSARYSCYIRAENRLDTGQSIEACLNKLNAEFIV